MIDSGPVALLLEGEAGIGKTTLWSQGLVSSAARGQRVLRCRPGERETQLAYAALGDLLAEVPDAAMADLPAPQRRALEVALLRAEPEGEQSLQRAVGLGLLGVLARAGRRRADAARDRRRPVARPPSESALAFVARRLAGRAPRILLRPARGRRATYRSSSTARSPVRASSDSTLGDLDAGELELLLRTDLGAPLSRRTLERVRRAAGGNLFFALEIGRALAARGGPLDPAEELPIPANLLELVRDRLELLPPGARAAAQVASALSRPTVRVVDAALAAARRAARCGRGRRGGRPRARRRASRIRAPAARDGRLPAARGPRSGARCTQGWPRCSTTPRSGPGISRWPRTSRTRPSRPRWTRPPGAPRRAARRTLPPICWSRLAG